MGNPFGVLPGMHHVTNDLIQPDAVFDLGENKRAGSPHFPGVVRHDFQIGPDAGCQIGFVDD